MSATPVIAWLDALTATVATDWRQPSHFPFAVIDGFLPAELAEAMWAEYPNPGVPGWDQTTFVHQKKKFTMRSGFPPAVAGFFTLAASPAFLRWVSNVTGIEALQADPALVGGGLHQIVTGGFLDVHVDYNLHPETKLHRRLNLLVYLNKDWRAEYGGDLELWNMAQGQRIARIAPLFNRAVIFETNEVSFHGHPEPLRTPPGVTRKSLALYYYTATRPAAAPEHNTLYKQTTGLAGYKKTLASAVESAIERAKRDGPSALAVRVAHKLARRLRGQPPENK